MNEKYCLDKDVQFEELGGGVKRKIMSHSEAMMIVKVCFETGAEGKLHQHPHEQITYVLEGEFEFNVSGVLQVVKAGDSIYMEPDCIHGAICLKEGKLLDIFTPHREDFLK